MANVRGGRWPLYAALLALSVIVVVGAFVMERRTLAASADVQVKKAQGLVAETIAPLVKNADLSKPLGPNAAAELSQQLDKTALSGSVIRIRLFAKNGILVFSTDDGDRVGSTKAGDDDAIRGASAGALSSVVDDDRVAVHGSHAESFQLLQAYAPIPDGDRTGGVAEIDMKYAPLVTASQQPWRMVQLGAAFLAVLFLELSLFGLARASASRRQADRSGFQAPKSDMKGGSKNAPTSAQQAKAAEKDAQIRQALEDQLETLRTQLKGQQEASANAAREFAEQLKAAAVRAEEAQARVRDNGDNEQKLRAAQERANALEQRVQQAEHGAQAHQARIAELEAKLADAERLAAEVRAEAERRLAEPVPAVQAPQETAPVVPMAVEAERSVVPTTTAYGEVRLEPDRDTVEPLNAEPLNAEPLNAEPLNAEPLNAEPTESVAEPEPSAAEPEPTTAEPVPNEPEPAEWVAEREKTAQVEEEAEQKPSGPSAGKSQIRGRLASGALERQAEAVRAASDDPHGALEEAAAAVFPFVTAGELKGADVAEVLVAAATEAGLAPEDARRTIAAAFLARRSA